MPRIEIIDKTYFIESLIMISIMFFLVLVVFFIGKGWYKKIKWFPKRKK